MAPFVVEEAAATTPVSKDANSTSDPTVQSLRKTLCTETTPLAQRFRALFSLKHLASLSPPTPQTLPAISAIAEAFASPSALLKHELAYCLGQSRNNAAIAPLRQVLEDRSEDPMCRHEAAEALGALGDESSLELLKGMRDDEGEEVVVRETCEIAVERIAWEHDERRREGEKLKTR
jgi:deoxyhypusine monooxygenase